MNSRQFEGPRFFVAKSQELSLSARALAELMRTVLTRGVALRFYVRGGSMSPFVRNGDVITVSPLQRVRPGVGEVVAFTRPGDENVVVHRVVAKRGPNAFIQGDAMPGYMNENIPPENLLGG